MPKKFDYELLEKMLDLRKQGKSLSQIGEILGTNEKRVGYYLHFRYSVRKNVYEHNHDPEVKKKRAARSKVLHNLNDNIIAVFDEDVMTAYQIKKSLEERCGINFSADFDDRIENCIESMQDLLGSNSPIRVKKPYVYRINPKSTYAFLCGKPMGED